MLALETESAEHDLGFLCSHAGVCPTPALRRHLENPQPSESVLEAAAWSPAVERNIAPAAAPPRACS